MGSSKRRYLMKMRGAAEIEANEGTGSRRNGILMNVWEQQE
jgi:hypothetical protein